MSVSPNYFVQAMDVDITADGASVVPHRSIPGYETLGLSAATARLDVVSELGLKGTVIRVIDRPVTDRLEWSRRRDKWASSLQVLIAEATARNLEVVVDPFSAALQPTGQWGLFADAEISGGGTIELIKDLTEVIVATGAQGIVTLGRVPREVEATKSVAGAALKIYSFSTNSETSAAYAGNPAHAVTNQKILPGNIADMLVWTLLDVHRGTDVLVTKPIENYHSIVESRIILRDTAARREFIASMLESGMLKDRDYEREGLDAILTDDAEFSKKASAVGLAAYTVSGTTQLLGAFARSEGTAIARARLTELWVNALASAGGADMVIIDRGASAYFSGTILH
ncbi:hypothetical protein C5D60_01150 [Rathayibacter toxicus]|uniref:Uncharacterized protein n=1 Tax=Rathayibacter toxicus TaxID=145458 RepID=A0A0U1PVS7_9MICO|nr:hypothetical protein APU90_05140 [Rathayibacter toxicus]KKM47244.1 hypothetical protein VT73_00685 [Rathayibacter toxicus]PPH25300.1 hypothetical protein C5D17_01095 [Rathayibacter toxicus]PPH61174.1 hypothetical protein C5C93_01115 [Rathayibacter toxicus]PPH89062.1 hypothetical protein C5D31_01120 [Rathayibacter toxicus]